MKLKHFLIGAMLSLLAVSCDGSILVDVATAEKTPDKNYQKILGVLNGYVYYQNDDGISRNKSTENYADADDPTKGYVLEGEKRLVDNAGGKRVEDSYLDTSSGSILYLSSDDDESSAYTTTIGVITSLDAEPTTSEATLEITGVNKTSEGYLVKGLHEDGSLVVKDETNKKVYICSSPSIATDTVTFGTAKEIDMSASGDTFHDLGTYLMDGTRNYSLLPVLEGSNDEDADNDDYYGDLHFYKDKTEEYATIENFEYRPAGFAVDETNSIIYILTTNGRLYRYTSSGTYQGYVRSGYSYGTGCMMYMIQNGDKNYFVTKPNYKSRAIIVLECDAAGSSITNFDDSSIRKGYAKHISSDLVNTVYELNASSHELLVGMNENGMVSITITADQVATNSSSNGTTTKAEQYNTKTT